MTKAERSQMKVMNRLEEMRHGEPSNVMHELWESKLDGVPLYLLAASCPICLTECTSIPLVHPFEVHVFTCPFFSQRYRKVRVLAKLVSQGHCCRHRVLR